MPLLQYQFLQHAVVAGIVVGLVAPLIGVFLVQRRLALLGDGMGHVALAGVGVAFLFGTAPVPTALAAAALGAVLIEVIRAKSRTAGDIALALLFYGGIALGVLLTALAGGKSSAALNQYLFGSLVTVSETDLVWLGIVALVVLAVLALAGRQIFVLALDPDLARTQGIRVTTTSTLLTVLAAVTVVIGMRTVGLLLVSAIMIVPVAAAQQVTRSFRTTMVLGVVLGEASALLGLVLSYRLDTPSGPAIVLVALLLFGVLAAVALPLRRRRRRVLATTPEPHTHGAP